MLRLLDGLLASRVHICLDLRLGGGSAGRGPGLVDSTSGLVKRLGELGTRGQRLLPIVRVLGCPLEISSHANSGYVLL